MRSVKTSSQLHPTEEPRREQSAGLSAECRVISEVVGDPCSPMAGSADLEQMRYQPIFDLNSMECRGAEALARFGVFDQVGAIGIVPSTEEIIRQAEERGEMVELGIAILRRCAIDWWQVMHRGWRLSINVSPVQLANPGYASSFLRTLPHRARVELEVTETSDVSIQAASLSNLSELRQAGVTVALDDVGEGANDIRRVLDIPCDRLKLSHRIIGGLGRGEGAEKRIAEVLETAQDLGIAVTAEGVETAEQLVLLRSVGCDCAQGYLLGRPMTMSALRKIHRFDLVNDFEGTGSAEGTAR